MDVQVARGWKVSSPPHWILARAVAQPARSGAKPGVPFERLVHRSGKLRWRPSWCEGEVAKDRPRAERDGKAAPDAHEGGRFVAFALRNLATSVSSHFLSVAPICSRRSGKEISHGEAVICAGTRRMTDFRVQRDFWPCSALFPFTAPPSALVPQSVAELRYTLHRRATSETACRGAATTALGRRAARPACERTKLTSIVVVVD